jgi:hypothetical protein
MPGVLTVEQFIKKSKEKHGDKYTYINLGAFKNSSSRMSIICPKHGIFKQIARTHYKGCGCPTCGYLNVSNCLSKSVDEFIREAKKVHNNRYSYSKVTYSTIKEKICIICPEHGEFLQSPESHLKGNGCKKCSGCYKKTTIDFIKNAIAVHGNKYRYNLVIYINSHTKIKIVCPKHGEFIQKPNTHLNGSGCPGCKVEKLTNNNPKRKNNEEFIAQAIIVHGDIYDYSGTHYERDNKPVTIICLKHGAFRQIANTHLSGSGCPICRKSLGEIKIYNFLRHSGINFIQQKKFVGCADKLPLPFDFYLPDKNICIEYDGEQHFKPLKIFGGMARYKGLKEHDSIKDNFCSKQKITLIRVSYKDNIEKVLKSFLL